MINHKSFIYIFAFMVFSLQNACTAETSLSKLYQEYPQDVLVGTDVLSLSKFKLAQQLEPTEYLSDIGGAIVKLKIIIISDKVKIQRTYSEPGLNEEFKVFNVTRTTNNTIKSKNIIIVPVNGGVLALEPNSDNVSLSADLWIFYKKGVRKWQLVMS